MAEEKYVPRLKTKYNNEVKQQLQDKFQYENVMMIPKFEKIVVNMGVGEAATDSKAIDGAVRDLHGRHRAAHLPRDRLRLRRSPAWYGHHFRDHRQHR